MNKLTKIVIVAGVVLGFVFILSGLGSEVNAGDPPDSVTISVIKDKKSAVVFPHKKHNLAGKCGNCHVSADGSGGLKPELKAKPADMAAAMKGPYHVGPVSCKGCHTSMAKGPKGCKDCHP